MTHDALSRCLPIFSQSDSKVILYIDLYNNLACLLRGYKFRISLYKLTLNYVGHALKMQNVKRFELSSGLDMPTKLYKTRIYYF